VEHKAVNVKICGITNLEDALVAAAAGADLLGFIFAPRSPRYTEPEQAAKIAAALRANGNAPDLVGVFVNESLKRVRAVAEAVQLDAVQLHGDESPQIMRELTLSYKAAPNESGSTASSMGRGLVARRFIAVRALRPRDEGEAQALVAEYRAVVCGSVPAFIVDAFDAQTYGGTGRRADWGIAAGIAREFPILLAGGLTAENVADAVRAVKPWGVDVSTGVERAPGLKDHDKVRRFIQTAKL
jgi:phosphoribosylanthranilate isomerase